MASLGANDRRLSGLWATSRTAASVPSKLVSTLWERSQWTILGGACPRLTENAKAIFANTKPRHTREQCTLLEPNWLEPKGGVREREVWGGGEGPGLGGLAGWPESDWPG